MLNAKFQMQTTWRQYLHYGFILFESEYNRLAFTKISIPIICRRSYYVIAQYQVFEEANNASDTKSAHLTLASRQNLSKFT